MKSIVVAKRLVKPNVAARLVAMQVWGLLVDKEKGQCRPAHPRRFGFASWQASLGQRQDWKKRLGHGQCCLRVEKRHQTPLSGPATQMLVRWAVTSSGGADCATRTSTKLRDWMTVTEWPSALLLLWTDRTRSLVVCVDMCLVLGAVGNSVSGE